MLFRFSPLLIARKCSVSHDAEHFYVVWRRFSLHIYARGGVFVNIYKYEAFLENISPKERKTLDFSVYVCYAGIVKVKWRCRRK